MSKSRYSISSKQEIFITGIIIGVLVSGMLSAGIVLSIIHSDNTSQIQFNESQKCSNLCYKSGGTFIELKPSICGISTISCIDTKCICNYGNYSKNIYETQCG